ncbi:hypothetical protein ABT147_42285 [Streptomyces sp. NPDC001868]|uniref:hypothetical protein n=1 Tax=Streptomyces sp. NPDC001868 TaxID=3154401 RepID=UPI0033296FBB
MNAIARRTIALTTGLLLSLVTAHTAAATPAAAVLDAGAVEAAACPGPGARVKTSTAPDVYLVDPEGFLRHIPSSTVYLQLYNNWSYTTISDSELYNCWPYADPGQYPLTNAYLVKTSSSPKIYIYDWGRDGYRWIINASTFEVKYGFSWGKVKTQELDPGSILNSWPWD